ncbi:helix-turn-helix domain-containing protein [Methylomonas rhizoryzae]|nr:helix-turn-helix transcriptional regulator [Methylomonas rhizoryzae]
MSPFGLFLERVRRSRQLQQKQLAADLGIQASYLSLLEKGRKVPPSKQVLEKLIHVLNLDEEEQAGMWDSAEQSQRNFQLPDGLPLEEYLVVNELRKQLGRLSKGQIKLMLDVLALGTTSDKQSNFRRTEM